MSRDSHFVDALMRRQRVLCVGFWAGVALLLPPKVSAQFLRIGPFDFTAKAEAGATWTDNVDGARPSEQTAEAKDYFIFGGLSLESATALSADGRMTIDTGFVVEKHFVREDLDNSENPLGHFRAEAIQPFAWLELNAFYNWERKSESVERVIPGVSSKTRNPYELKEFGYGADWRRGPLSLGAGYEYSEERYDKAEYRVGDVDTTTINYDAMWKINDRADVTYEAEFKREEYLNVLDVDPYWDTTETILFNFDLELWRHPRTTFAFGVEREDQEDKQGDWEPKYEIKMEDEIDLSPVLKLSGDAMYTYEAQPEDDDIAFTYGVKLEHEINSSTRHFLELTREPRATFGSTEETDTTTYTYNLKLEDLFLPELSLMYETSYEVRKAPETLDEHIWSYTLQLEHLKQVTTRLKRSLKYVYEAEDSDFYDELLVENRVEWAYEYDL